MGSSMSLLLLEKFTKWILGMQQGHRLVHAWIGFATTFHANTSLLFPIITRTGHGTPSLQHILLVHCFPLITNLLASEFPNVTVDANEIPFETMSEELISELKPLPQKKVTAIFRLYMHVSVYAINMFFIYFPIYRAIHQTPELSVEDFFRAKGSGVTCVHLC